MDADRFGVRSPRRASTPALPCRGPSPYQTVGAGFTPARVPGYRHGHRRPARPTPATPPPGARSQVLGTDPEFPRDSPPRRPRRSVSRLAAIFGSLNEPISRDKRLTPKPLLPWLHRPSGSGNNPTGLPSPGNRADWIRCSARSIRCRRDCWAASSPSPAKRACKPRGMRCCTTRSTPRPSKGSRSMSPPYAPLWPTASASTVAASPPVRRAAMAWSTCSSMPPTTTSPPDHRAASGMAPQPLPDGRRRAGTHPCR